MKIIADIDGWQKEVDIDIVSYDHGVAYIFLRTAIIKAFHLKGTMAIKEDSTIVNFYYRGLCDINGNRIFKADISKGETKK
jgi:hypothetical protein